MGHDIIIPIRRVELHVTGVRGVERGAVLLTNGEIFFEKGGQESVGVFFVVCGGAC